MAHFASLRPFVGGEGDVWGWKAEAGCRAVRTWGAARVLVAGAASFETALLRAEVQATPQCKREAAPQDARGLGDSGGQGAGSFWLDP